MASPGKSLMPANNRALVRSVIGLILGTVALTVVIGFALFAGEQTRIRADQLSRAEKTHIAASTLLRTLVDAETGQRGYLITGNSAYLQPYQQARAIAADRLNVLQRSLAAEHLPSDLRVLQSLITQKLDELRLTIGLAEGGDVAGAVARVKTNQGRQLMEDIRSRLQTINDTADQRAGRLTDSLALYALMLRYVTIAGAVLALVLGLGSILIAAGYVKDLTAAHSELERFNQTLEQRVAARTLALTRANEEIQRFAYIVSHDLRAPLVNVMGFTSELEHGLAVCGKEGARLLGPTWNEPPAREMREAVTHEMPEAIDFIRSSTRRMDGLINAILKLSREGARVLAPERIDLAALFEQTVSALNHQIQDKRVEVLIHRPMPMIVSDRLALEQIIGNLIDNAIKYLSPSRPGRVAARAFRRDGQAVIEIQDNGRGVAPQDLQRIFELFRRAGAQDQPGEGIGLAHVRALVRRLGGEIDIESEVDVGSTFQIVLPLTPATNTQENA
jgi:signal transduction histidine kinase